MILAAWTLLGMAAQPAAPPAVAQTAADSTSCIVCHSDEDFFDQQALDIVHAFTQDVHREVGLSCHDCHGGNPDPRLADDLDAMDEAFTANPYRGSPQRDEVPGFCGRCHSDPSYMKRFKPDVRVDQEQEYWTSHHGRALEAGDTNVAVCVDCHGVHGMARSDHPNSPVYPTRIAETCAACHSDAERMAGYTLPGGEPLPVDQHPRWRQSVHAQALLEKEDLSAPTCNDCHGNHGAAPPGLDSIAFVCGQCHAREAELFRASAKQAALAVHNEFLEEAGTAGCAECHEDPEPAAQLTGVHSFSECASCHGNHGVVRPTVAMLTPLPATPCAFCHEQADVLAPTVREPEAVERRYEEMRNAFLAEAERTDLEGDARFDWLVDKALALPFHRLPTVPGAVDGDGSRLRPEFERLFDKFRIGKTYFTYRDPATGEEVRAPVVRCHDCHASEPLLADEPKGLRLAQDLLDRTQALTSQIARAERIVLSARRGGVETRDALDEIDRAVDAQIEFEVLVHGFSGAPTGALVKKHEAGIEHARLALEAGQQALQELGFRRRGLGISLVFIVLVLIGLAVKIRQL